MSENGQGNGSELGRGEFIDPISGDRLRRCEICWLPSIKERCKACLAGEEPDPRMVEISRAFVEGS